MGVFLTKNQKRLMRERKRKKKLYEQAAKEGVSVQEIKARRQPPQPQSSSASSHGKKRPLSSIEATSAATSETSSSTNVIEVPANLTAKEAKKFRKDARRRAREQGQDETKLEFVAQGHQPNTKEPPPKKSKRSFPRINDLVEQEKKQKEQERKEQALKKSEESLSEDYKARYLAMDCEMVGIGSDGKQSALARVSIVDWHGQVVLDRFVQVPSRVTDFRTWVSGVTAKHLKSSDAMQVTDCRSQVAQLLKDKVLVGHALKNDLDALLLQHPKPNIRDTAKFRPFQRHGGNKWRPRKLKDLALERLDLKIQEQGQSHDSVDDARAAMELFKLEREVWEKELERKYRKKSHKK